MWSHKAQVEIIGAINGHVIKLMSTSISMVLLIVISGSVVGAMVILHNALGAFRSSAAVWLYKRMSEGQVVSPE